MIVQSNYSSSSMHLFGCNSSNIQSRFHNRILSGCLRNFVHTFQKMKEYTRYGNIFRLTRVTKFSKTFLVDEGMPFYLYSAINIVSSTTFRPPVHIPIFPEAERQSCRVLAEGGYYCKLTRRESPKHGIEGFALELFCCFGKCNDKNALKMKTWIYGIRKIKFLSRKIC